MRYSPNEAFGIRDVLDAIRRLLSRRPGPVVVALDGGSGAGKSTLASAIAEELDAVVIPLDDFFSAEIPDDRWDAFSVEERLQHVFDWKRLRRDALEPLLAGNSAKWHAFDFESGLRPDATYGMRNEPTEKQPAGVILVEGAYSAHPELSHLVDLAVLVDVPIHERHARLSAREPEDFLGQWHLRWDPVEAYYFREVRPKSSFDVVVRPS